MKKEAQIAESQKQVQTMMEAAQSLSGERDAARSRARELLEEKQGHARKDFCA